jgi:glycosyltransferase involved in cell wall biosynthesis
VAKYNNKPKRFITMKIAIYHNLEKGGALKMLIELAKNLHKNNTIDLYCHKPNIPKGIFNNVKKYPIKKTSNVFQGLHQTIFELKDINRNIALDISKVNYDLVFIFQCTLTQSPYLLRYLNKNIKSVYFWNESKREFYENTSYDYYSLKRVFTRLIRLPIKLIDKNNCKKAKLIVSCSEFASKQLKKIYNQKSVVVHPGLKPIKPKKITIINKKNFVSIGPYQKIKGYVFSLNQLNKFVNSFTIISHRTGEYEYIKKVALKNNIKINEIDTNNDRIKIKELKKYTFYLANYENEPFGIATLEAIENNLFVIGKNQGGTKEIIKNKINGTLYPDDLVKARLVISKLLKLKYITFYKTCALDWKFYTENIMKTFKEYYA